MLQIDNFPQNALCFIQLSVKTINSTSFIPHFLILFVVLWLSSSNDMKIMYGYDIMVLVWN